MDQFTVIIKITADGETTRRTIELDSDDLNDVEWIGGNTGDQFFDNADNDSERLECRISDMVAGELEDDPILEDAVWVLHNWPSLEFFEKHGLLA